MFFQLDGLVSLSVGVVFPVLRVAVVVGDAVIALEVASYGVLSFACIAADSLQCLLEGRWLFRVLRVAEDVASYMACVVVCTELPMVHGEHGARATHTQSRSVVRFAAPSALPSRGQRWAFD